MRIEPTSATGLFGAMLFSSWELVKILDPISVSAVAPNNQASVSSIRVTDKAGDSAVASSGSVPINTDALDEHQQALHKKVELLKKARAFIASKKSYTATLEKREVVHGQLLDEQSITMKVRMKPHSVYLLWNTGDVGREAIYIEGQNNGKMIAHDGGWKSRLPAFCLEPECTLAMRDARYPITSAGLSVLIDTMLNMHESDLKNKNFGTCQLSSNEQFDGRPTIKITTCYQSKDVSPTYRKSITLFDQETSIPVSTEHYEWQKQAKDMPDHALDEATLIERYSFHNLSFDEELTEKDFDRSNPHYHFR